MVRMVMRFAIIVLCTSVLAFGAVRGADQPIQLHPDNPHYFLWRGQPTVLITSGEHYGAVLNADFDYGGCMRLCVYCGAFYP